MSRPRGRSSSRRRLRRKFHVDTELSMGAKTRGLACGTNVGVRSEESPSHGKGSAEAVEGAQNPNINHNTSNTDDNSIIFLHAKIFAEKRGQTWGFRYLPGHEARVHPAHAHEAVVRALLNQPSLVHHGNVVSVHDRRQPGWCIRCIGRGDGSVGK